jgi:hypothetical protein
VDNPSLSDRKGGKISAPEEEFSTALIVPAALI